MNISNYNTSSTFEYTILQPTNLFHNITFISIMNYKFHRWRECIVLITLVVCIFFLASENFELKRRVRIFCLASNTLPSWTY